MTTTPRPALDLFTGTGALGRAANRVLHTNTVAIAEINPHASRVAEAAHPDVVNLVDAVLADYRPFAPVVAAAAGTPCQDVSKLGRRKGMGAGTRSGLWSAYCRAIAETEPRWVVWENVTGVLSTRTAAGADMRALGRVLADLDTLGYDVQWRTVRASDVGAPHARARVFLLARERNTAEPLDPIHGAPPFAWYDSIDDEWVAGVELDGDPYVDVWPTDGAVIGGRAYYTLPIRPLYPRLPLLRTPVASEAGGGPLSTTVAAARGQTLRLTGQLLSLHAPGVLPEVEGTELRPAGWHEYGPAIGRWEEITGRPCPEPLIAGRNRPTSNPVFGEWLMRLPRGLVTDQPITHREKWAAIGNGVVEDQAVHALTGMLAAYGLGG